MKRLYCLILCLLFFCHVGMPAVYAEVSARHMCVMDAATGRVLYEKNAYERHGMASTTKIITAIVALENADINDIATVSVKASVTEGSSLYLKAGEKIRIEDLVYGLMLNSGNDAAVVLAEHIGGDVDRFSIMMNDKAREIGAKNTHFVNPNGLSHDDHYTTAYDLALITRYALQNETFAKIVNTETYRINLVGNSRVIVLNNHNKLLKQLDGCDGVKTGFTKATGRCLVSSVTRDGWQAICVTLDASSDWADHTQILNEMFAEYKPKQLISKGQFMRTADIVGGEEKSVRLMAEKDLFVPAKEGETFDFDVRYVMPQRFLAPVGYSQKLGEAQLFYNGQVLGKVGLISENAVYVQEKKTGYFHCFWKVLQALFRIAEDVM